MNDRDHAMALLELARADLQAIKGMQHPSLLGKGFFTDEIFGFHAQQAIEKTLKAWLALKGVKYPRTHDIMVLLQLLENSGEDITKLQALVDLNSFAVQYRYETFDDDDVIDRGEILTQVEETLDAVALILGS